jgi:hypothetical protein
VNVTAAHLDEVKWWNLVHDGKHHRSHAAECHKESCRRDKKPPSRAVGDALMKSAPEGRSMQEQEQEHRPCDGEKQNEPRVGHAPLDRIL